MLVHQRVYGNIYHQYTPVMLALIYQHHGSVLGYEKTNMNKKKTSHHDAMKPDMKPDYFVDLLIHIIHIIVTLYIYIHMYI